MSGDLPAGSRLKVRDLAAQVGTSVLPVREAIRRLEEAGLAERSPHKGAVVKGLTLEELVHVYDVRRVLEVEAARAGAERITPEDCDRMAADYDAMRVALAEGRVAASLDLDESLLTILYQASGNPVLVELIRTLWNRSRAYKLVGQDYSVADDAVWKYQLDLIAAARKNDADAAAAVNDASLVDATSRIKGLLAAQPPAAP